jgi:hypothetical protein
VPKYDAFGREIGADTLAGLGGGGDAGTEATAIPSDAPPAPAPAQPQPQPQPDPRPDPKPAPSFEIPARGTVIVRRRRGSGLGCLVSLIVLGAIVAVPIVALVSFVDDAGNTIDEITGRTDTGPDPEPAEPAEPVKPPSGLRGASMVAPANFGKALKRLGGLGGATLIRLSPDRVDAQLVKGSRQRSAQVDFAGKLVRGPATAGGSNLGKVALSGIDRSAPARLVRGSAARYSVREQGINYLVLSLWPGEGQRWVAYFKNGVYVQGDRNGKVLRKISGP